MERSDASPLLESYSLYTSLKPFCMKLFLHECPVRGIVFVARGVSPWSGDV